MAIIGTDDDPTNPANAANPTQPGQVAGANVTGGSGAFVGGGSGQGATTKVGGAAASPTSSGSYTNLSQYLQANQGGGATNGQAAENVIQTDANNANSALGQYNTDTANQIKTGGANVAVDQSVLNNINSGGKAPTAAYNGPTADQIYGGTAPGASGTDYSSVMNAIGAPAASGKAAFGLNGDVANANGGQSGMAALLGKANGGATTAGENNLDAFLANGTTPGIGATATGVGNGVNTAFQNAQTNFANNATGLTNEAGTTNGIYANAAAAYKPPPISTDSTSISASAPKPTPPPPPPGGSGTGNYKGPASIPDPMGVSNNGTLYQKMSGAGPPITNLVPQIVNVAKTYAGPLNPISQGQQTWNQVQSWGVAAHGGEVPSYSQLMNTLKGARK